MKRKKIGGDLGFKKEKVALFGDDRIVSQLLSHAVSDVEVVGIITDCNDNNIKTMETNIPFEKVHKLYLHGDIERIVIAFNSGEPYSGAVRRFTKKHIYKISVLKKSIFRSADDKCVMGCSWDDIQPLEECNVIPYLEINLIDACNLNCKGCTHFSNLYQKDGDTEVSLEQYKKDIQRISENTTVLRLRLLGGEPLLCKNLLEEISFARERMPYTEIHIVTNGLLLLKQSDVFFSCLCENKIIVDISSYPPTLKIKDQIQKKLREKNVVFDFSPPIKEFSRIIIEDGNSEMCKAHQKCAQSDCTFLRAGKLYVCPMEGLLYKYIENYDIKGFSLDLKKCGIDIYNEGLDWKNLYNCLYSNPVPICKYCSESGGELFKWEVSLSPQKEEWLSKK